MKTLWKLRAAAGLVGITIFACLRATAADMSPQLRAAIQPLDDGVPQVAAVRLRAFLAQQPTEADKTVAASKLAEALLASSDAVEALKVLDGRDLHGDASADYLRAQALAALQRWADALPIYQRLAADTASPLRANAMFGAAEAMRAVGQPDAALEMFGRLFAERAWGVRARLRAVELVIEKRDLAAATRLLDETKAESRTERSEKRFLRGRLEAASGQTQKAIDAYQAVLKNQQGVTHPVLIAVLLALADAHLQAKTPEAGDDALEDFIEDHPNDESLAAIFAKLDELYAVERKTGRTEFGRWSRNAAQPRQGFALWHSARAELRAGRRDSAVSSFQRLREVAPKTAEFAPAFVEYAQLEMDNGEFDAVIDALGEARDRAKNPALLARVDMLAGQANYRSKHFDAAAPAFEEAAHLYPQFAPTAIYNAALSSLRMGNHAQFLVDATELNAQPSDQSTRAELGLEEGLIAASRGDKTATASLQKFVADYPESERVSEAWVALAELDFHATPPRVTEARKNLERATHSRPTAAAIERGDYLAIWLEDAAPSADGAQIIRLATEFLQKHPQSAFTGDVRMKLAETYFRRQDFPNAQTQFELLARANPNGAFAEKALFFAAESAMSSMAPQSLERAIVLLDEVVRKDGELKWTARNEQASIERKLGKDQDALLLYEEVLKNSAKPAERREALCGKGDIYSAAASGNTDNYKRAIEAFDQLAAERETLPHWRNQALFKKAVCLEKLQDRDAALATYYTALEEDARPNRPHEFFWFYKAGFSAARLLEEQEKWQGAAAIYEKLASAGGPRSEEAKTRLSRLRLEHFLWDE
jgi:outer membrane protein assembly factor BamD (BamD/ComL family)